MKSKLSYDPNGTVTIQNREWEWQVLKQCCHHDFVYEARAMGMAANKYKLPKSILSDWIKNEDWEKDKKSYWQRPYSLRIDSLITGLIQNVVKLVEIQKEIKDIEFNPKNLLSRVRVEVELKEGNKFIRLKTFTLEKYKITISDEIDEFGHKAFDDYDEIRYKVGGSANEILIKGVEKAKGNPKASM